MRLRNMAGAMSEKTLPAVSLGADSLCWHARLARGMTMAAVIEEAAAAGAGGLDITLEYLERTKESIEALARQAEGNGLALFTTGHGLGRADDTNPADAAARVGSWLEAAQAMGSPVLKVFSGFYRTDADGQPDRVRREQDFVTSVLKQVAPAASRAGVSVQLENCSDFTPEELEAIDDAVDSDHVGIFLDVANPVGILHDPVDMVGALAMRAGPVIHVKDYRIESVWRDDRFHRLGFDVRWCYPGEGASDLDAILRSAFGGVVHEHIWLIVEGLDSEAGRDDQIPRLRESFRVLDSLTSTR